MSYLTGAIYPTHGETVLNAPLETAVEAYQAGASAVALGYISPTDTELAHLQSIFKLHELAIEDSMLGHQRAKLERYGDSLLAVVRPAVYLDAEEEVHLGEVHLFVGRNYLVCIVQDKLRTPERMREVLGGFFAEPDASIARLLHRILDNTVDRYMPVLSGLETDSDEIEDALFPDGGKNRGISQRIYGLLNQVIDFQRACKPLDSMLVRIVEDLRIGALDASPRPGVTPRRVEDESVELQRQFRDVHDHVMQIRDRLEDLHTSLQNALTVHDTLVAQQQNEDMKRISAGAAILVVPTIIGSIYGMNFEYLPELKWEYGYPASLLLMVLACVGVYFFFKKRGWF